MSAPTRPRFGTAGTIDARRIAGNGSEHGGRVALPPERALDQAVVEWAQRPLELSRRGTQPAQVVTQIRRFPLAAGTEAGEDRQHAAEQLRRDLVAEFGAVVEKASQPRKGLVGVPQPPQVELQVLLVIGAGAPGELLLQATVLSLNLVVSYFLTGYSTTISFQLRTGGF